MTTLKDVQKDPKKLDQFIKEREKDTPPADKEKLDKIVKSMSEGKQLRDDKR